MYSELQPDRIRETIANLQQRIEESFPESGLWRVTAELGRRAEEAAPAAHWLNRPMWLLRIGAALGIAGIVGVTLGLTNLALRIPLRIEGIGELIQASEAAANELILLSLAIFFLISLETRVKRSRALAALHQLRSIVHIVDMHQLTKDPQQLLAPSFRTQHPPKRTYTRFELARYLDYCSDLLSLASKLAALHVQYFNDPVVLSAVNDIETLAAGLSNKIWQKIMILDVVVPAGEELPSGAGFRRDRREPTPQRALARCRHAGVKPQRRVRAGVPCELKRSADRPRSA